MSEAAAAPKPKKSVALSGVPAGNTALCTVGRSGNDLHYRGYDILDFADEAEFEEVAYLLVHEKLPNAGELASYKKKLRALRGMPPAVMKALEAVPPSAHPMDVMRTGVSALGTVLPEPEDHPAAGARDIADRLMASLGSMLLYWHHYSREHRRIEVRTDDDSIGGHFLHLLHGKPPSAEWVRAMHTSLILYAEHEFNASTFTCRVIAGTGSDMYSAITGGIGALRGPKHGGANEVSDEIQRRYRSPDEADADIRRRMAAKEIVIGFGHPVYTTGDPRNKVIKAVAERLSKEANDMTQYRVAERIDYDAFGNVLSDSVPGFQPFGFAGGLRDVDAGLTRFGARDYDPAAGMWTAKDAIGFEGSLNFYGYAGNDPVDFVDPTGLIVRFGDAAGRRLWGVVRAVPEGTRMADHLESSPNEYVIYGDATLPGDEVGEALDGREDAPALRHVGDLEAVLLLQADHQLEEVDRIEIEAAAHERSVVPDAVGIDPLQAQAAHDETLQFSVEPVAVAGHGRAVLISERPASCNDAGRGLHSRFSLRESRA